MSDRQHPNSSLLVGSPEIRNMHVIIPGPVPMTGPIIASLPPLPCVPAMASIMFPALGGRLNPEFQNFAYNGPFNPGIGWGFHFEGSVPLYADAERTIIDGRASSAVSLRGISDLLKRVAKLYPHPDSSGSLTFLSVASSHLHP